MQSSWTVTPRRIAPLTWLLAASLLLSGCSRLPGIVPSTRTKRVQRSQVFDWEGTGVGVIAYTPKGWNVGEPTVLFMPGGGIAPRAYGCYGKTWGQLGIRTLILELADGASRNVRRERWRELVTVYGRLTAQQASRHVVIAGHSAGAYLTLIAAGANSRLGTWATNHCTTQGCTSLAAAGYVIISGQGAQSGEGDPPFWFARDAFRHLEPNRFVVYGTRDYAPGDPCISEENKAPTCRADAFTVDQDSGGAGQSVLRVVDGFTHNDFICHQSQLGALGQSERRRELTLEMGQWIRSVARR